MARPLVCGGGYLWGRSARRGGQGAHLAEAAGLTTPGVADLQQRRPRLKLLDPLLSLARFTEAENCGTRWRWRWDWMLLRAHLSDDRTLRQADTRTHPRDSSPGPSSSAAGGKGDPGRTPLEACSWAHLVSRPSASSRAWEVREKCHCDEDLWDGRRSRFRKRDRETMPRRVAQALRGGGALR